ncbi:SPOR domain-containing protein [Rhodoferax sp. UBA5149]|uniref:SPOR domain-containing protein n=1 Tax=Rhodoferax sp. UBA5149 TaxID=1947379 RepID=UPI0025D58BF5|nr:SPOR domain-containing protein [Rhodoferax sp. UBA5149]
MASEPENPLANGVTAELYKAAIGPQGQAYYLRHFFQFDAAGKTGVSWHWPACAATLSWLVYRRMWRWALAYGAALLGLALLVFGVGKLAFHYSEATGLLLLLLFATVAVVLPGLYANAWYYTSCSEKISVALRDTTNIKEACAVLARQASSRRRGLGLAAANGLVLALAASAAAFVLSLGPTGAHLAQSGLVTAAAKDLTVALQPVAAASSVVAREAVPAVPAVPDVVAIVRPAPAPAAPPTQPKPVPAKHQWFVQVGAFADAANAHKARTQVAATGLASSAESSDTPAGRLIRVRAGPFDSKGEAERAALQIRALELPAVLFRQ